MKPILLTILILGLFSSCKKDIIYDQYHDYRLDGITLDVIPPIKLLKNVTGPLLPGKKEKYRTGTWQCIDKRKTDTMYINELNLKYY